MSPDCCLLTLKRRNNENTCFALETVGCAAANGGRIRLERTKPAIRWKEDAAMNDVFAEDVPALNTVGYILFSFGYLCDKPALAGVACIVMFLSLCLTIVLLAKNWHFSDMRGKLLLVRGFYSVIFLAAFVILAGIYFSR